VATVRDAKDEARQRAEEIYQRLMREMRTDLERRMRMRTPVTSDHAAHGRDEYVASGPSGRPHP
jgi:hypothetical protein